MRAFRKCRNRTLFAHITAVSIFAVCTIFSATGKAAEYDLSSRSYLNLYERETVAGQTEQFASLYEYLSLDVWEIGERDLSFHLYGWGRLDLGDESRGGDTNGDLSSAYLQYRDPWGNRHGKLGRFFLTEGTTAEMLDGLLFKGLLWHNFGASVYGGAPVENSIIAADEGDAIFGGRIYYVLPGVTEFGLGYFFEEGDFQGDNREEFGGDLWIRFARSLDLAGRAVYNIVTSDFAKHRLTLRLVPVHTVDLVVGTEEYQYKDLFQKSLHSAFLPPTVNPDDKVQSLFAKLDWQTREKLSLQAGVKSISHDEKDPGDATRGDVGLRLKLDGSVNLLGLSAAVQTADLSENEYQTYRGWLMGSVNRFSYSLDALTYLYEEKIDGEDTTYQVVGSAGFRFSPTFALSGDDRYTQSPRFEEDLAVLLRADLSLGSSGGGN